MSCIINQPRANKYNSTPARWPTFITAQLWGWGGGGGGVGVCPCEWPSVDLQLAEAVRPRTTCNQFRLEETAAVQQTTSSIAWTSPTVGYSKNDEIFQSNFTRVGATLIVRTNWVIFTLNSTQLHRHCSSGLRPNSITATQQTRLIANSTCWTSNSRFTLKYCHNLLITLYVMKQHHSTTKL